MTAIEKAKHVAAIATAYAEGKTIQFRCKDHCKDKVWRVICATDNSIPSFNFAAYEYRLKPSEPRVIFINEYSDDPSSVRSGFVHMTLENANRDAVQARVRVSKWIEVLE